MIDTQLTPAVFKFLIRMVVGDNIMIGPALEDHGQKLICIDHLDNSGQELRQEPKEEARK